MKTQTRMKFLFVFLPFLTFSQLKEEPFFGENPGNLKMFSFTDEGVEHGKRPLVVALHGCSQTANSLAKQSGWNKLAKEHQFVVIYPQQKRSNNGSNCFNWFKKKDHSKDSGESQSIKSMIDLAVKNYDIDTSKIFIYGLSAGAAMSVSMMANYPELFHTGAIFAGAPHRIVEKYSQAVKAMNGKIDKKPEEWGKLITNDPAEQDYPKLIVFHGEKDGIVDINNARELIEQWSYLHQTDAEQDSVIEHFANNENVQKISYWNKNKEEVITFYKIANLGHALPVDPGENKKQGGETGAFAKDMDFFSTYYVAKDFGLVKMEGIE